MHRARRNRLFRFWPVAAVIAAGAIVAAMLVPLSAQADTVALAGTVQNASGSQLAGVTVTALPTGSLGATQSAVTSTSGAFAFGALAAGEYTLSFSATSTTFAQYLGNTSVLANAETMELFPGADAEDRSYVGVTLSNSGTISGKVSKLPSGALAKYTVRALAQAADGSWSIDRSAVTSTTGTYSLTGLEPGSYALEALDLTSAHPLYSPTFSGGATTVDAATTVGVLAKKATSYNFALGKAGSETGTVVGSYGGTSLEPVPGTHVTVYRVTGSTPNETATALDTPGTVTSATGAYTVSGLSPGRYTLEFQPPSTPSAHGGQVYGRTFLGNYDDPIDAQGFIIGNGTAVSGLGVTLSAGATVAGTVTGNSNPLPNIRVSIDYAGRNQDAPSEHAASLITGADGAFSFSGLGAGDYELWVGSTAYATSNHTPAEDMTWVRQAVSVPGVTSGSLTTVPVSMAKRVGPALSPTTFPSIENAGTSVGDSASIASNGAWTDPTLDSSDFRYQWTRDEKPIPGETGESYTFKPGDMNHAISVNVTATSFGYGTATVEATGGIVLVSPGTINDPFPLPSVAGSDTVGQTLTVTPGTYDVGGVLTTYDWQYYNHSTSTWIDTDEPGTLTHVVTASDWQHSDQLRVVVTASRDGYINNIVYAAPSAGTTLGTLSQVTAPTIKKSATTFSVVGGTWSPAAFDSISYQWNVYNSAGTQVSTSLQPTLPVAGTAGDQVTVIVRHNLAGYNSTYSSVITGQLANAPIASGSTAISGTPAVDADIFAPTPTWTPSSGTTTYQWQYKSGTTWKTAAGTSSSSFYQPAASDLGRLFRVIVTRHLDGLQNATLIAQASTAVALGAADGTIVSPVVSGTYGTGDTVSTTAGTWLQPGGVYSYQWMKTTNFEFGPFTAIAGATKSTFVIPQNLVGDYLFVVVTSKVPGHQVGTSHGYLPGSTQPTIVTDKLTPLTAATVTHVGSLYTVHGGTFTPAAAPGSTTYNWEYFDETTNTWKPDGSITPLPGQLSASIDVGTSDSLEGVVVSGTTTGYTETDAPIVIVHNGTISIPSSSHIDLPPASTVGQPITPVQPDWGVNSPTIKYQWREETTPSSGVWKNIAGATGGTFTPSAAYVNQELDVVETVSKANYTSDVVVSRSTNANPADAPTPGTSTNAPSITGDDLVGSTLTAHPGTWNTTGLTFHYSWQVSTNGTNWTSIPGATAATYLIPLTAIETDYFQVTITASKAGYNNGTGTAATVTTAGFGNLTEVKAPVVTAKNGVYTVTTGTWKPASTNYNYTWKLYDPATDSSTDVATGTNTYTLLPADSTKKLVVYVGVNVPDYSGLNNPILAHAGPKIVSSTAPILSGTPVLGGDLTATFGTWSTPSPTVTAQWFANGVAVPGAGTGLTFHLSGPLIGKTISAKFTVARFGYTTAVYSATSTPVFSNQVLAPTVKPVIAGTPKVDKTLSISSGTWNATGLTLSYRWYRNGNPIPAATSTSYVLTAADDGQEITAGVTASRAYFTPVEFRPDTVTIDDGDVVAFTGSPVTITNTPIVGNVLTAKLGTFALPVTVQYSWFVNNAASPGWQLISGAHSNTYTVSAADGVVVGSEIEVRILVERAGHTPEQLTSVPVTDGVSP